jgi:hypothetical protein
MGDMRKPHAQPPRRAVCNRQARTVTKVSTTHTLDKIFKDIQRTDIIKVDDNPKVLQHNYPPHSAKALTRVHLRHTPAMAALKHLLNHDDGSQEAAHHVPYWADDTFLEEYVDILHPFVAGTPLRSHKTAPFAADPILGSVHW